MLTWLSASVAVPTWFVVLAMAQAARVAYLAWPRRHIDVRV